MNKRTIIISLLTFATIVGQAQEIRTNEPTLDDYLYTVGTVPTVLRV